MEEVIVTTEYKHHCLHLVYRSMKITKLEKLVLAYFIMRADQEAHLLRRAWNGKVHEIYHV